MHYAPAAGLPGLREALAQRAQQESQDIIGRFLGPLKPRNFADFFEDLFSSLVSFLQKQIARVAGVQRFC